MIFHFHRFLRILHVIYFLFRLRLLEWLNSSLIRSFASSRLFEQFLYGGISAFLRHLHAMCSSHASRGISEGNKLFLTASNPVSMILSLKDNLEVYLNTFHQIHRVSYFSILNCRDPLDHGTALSASIHP